MFFCPDSGVDKVSIFSSGETTLLLRGTKLVRKPQNFGARTRRHVGCQKSRQAVSELNFSILIETPENWDTFFLGESDRFQETGRRKLSYKYREQSIG